MINCVNGHFFVRQLVGSKNVVVMVCRRCGEKSVVEIGDDFMGDKEVRVIE